MLIKRPSYVRALLAALVIFSPLVQAQDLVLTAPPREKPAAGQKQYGPIAVYLTKLLGRPVKYVYPGNWLKYQRDMRDDKYDIVFDGPHFASWRIAHLGNSAIVRLPGSLVFYLVAKKDDDKVNKISDMVAKKFCGIPPPNLATLSILAAMSNPVQQPVTVPVRGGAATVFKAFVDGKCEAVVVRSAFFKMRLKPEEQAKYKIVFASRPFPNQSITVSKRVTQRERQLMVQALTMGDGVKATLPTLKRFGGKAKHFIPANDKEFDGINNLLEGVIFGWE